MLTDEFVESVIPILDIRAKTKKNYLGAYKKNLKDAIGNMEIAQVTKADIIKCLDPLPPQTRYQTLMMARRVFSEAVERGHIDENPAKTIKAPRIVVKDQKFLTWEELSKIDFGKQTKRIRFLALHGLRFGEAAALTPQDIKGTYIHVTKSKHGQTKSKAGIRKIPLIEEYVQFPKYQGSIAKALKPYGVTVHSLRKTYAYILKSTHTHVTTASRLMGHSNASLTLNVYTKVKDDEIEKSGVAISDFIKMAS
jgi:integrase